MGIAAIRQRLNRLGQLRRLGGIWTAVAWVGYRLAQRLTGVSVAHYVWLDVAKLNQALCPEAAFTFRFLSAAEVRNYSTNPENWLNPALADGIEEGTEYCFAALAQERLAAFVWYSLRGTAVEYCAGTRLSYPSDAAYLYHSYTHPDFRGRRLHGIIAGLGLRALGVHGVTKLIATVDWANWASKRSCFRLGFVDLGCAVVLQYRRFRVGSYPPAAERLGVKFNEEATVEQGDAKRGKGGIDASRSSTPPNPKIPSRLAAV
jgi:hypothetical protein